MIFKDRCALESVALVQRQNLILTQALIFLQVLIDSISF
ncbi:hypothetical protein FTV88_0120 [Heliorestis convoluta]|uniref:Uncharacterized protein n=1 Tax=Heliorestis convoluta TaxID=356322 RepID=A0A5Q2MY88_9FIRM|nr:hypothetical protein FTV88_0120 [Heliorestis convoluta]